MIDLFAPDPFGETLAALGLIQVRNGQQYAPDPERLERVLQGLAAYRAALRPTRVPAAFAHFQIKWPFVGICAHKFKDGRRCGAHYRLDLPGGVERAKQHQDNLKHAPWQTVFCKPWTYGPDTTIEQPGEHRTIRPPKRDPGQLVVPPYAARP
jgi:hypothetical protein